MVGAQGPGYQATQRWMNQRCIIDAKSRVRLDKLREGQEKIAAQKVNLNLINQRHKSPIVEQLD